MNLGNLRRKIDGLDAKLVELVNRRLALAAEIGKIKRKTGGEIFVPEREDAVMRKVCAQNKGPIKNEALRAIYREIMSAAIALEKKKTVAAGHPDAAFYEGKVAAALFYARNVLPAVELKAKA